MLNTGSTSNFVSPAFATVHRIHAFPLEQQLTLQLGCVGSRSRIIHGANAQIRIGAFDAQLYFEHIYLGSPKKLITVADVATLSASRSFRDFCKKLTLFLNDFLPQANIPIPGGTGIVIVRETDKVSISYGLSAPAAFLLLCTQLQEF